MSSEYSISYGWTESVPVPVVTTNTQDLAGQLKMLGRMYNVADSTMTPREQANMDGLIHWLTEIQVQLKESDVVVLEEVE